jgi:hypothetical protein
MNALMLPMLRLRGPSPASLPAGGRVYLLGWNRGHGPQVRLFKSVILRAAT